MKNLRPTSDLPLIMKIKYKNARQAGRWKNLFGLVGSTRFELVTPAV